jgi:hypothetical protein
MISAASSGLSSAEGDGAAWLVAVAFAMLMMAGAVLIAMRSTWATRVMLDAGAGLPLPPDAGAASPVGGSAKKAPRERG